MKTGIIVSAKGHRKEIIVFNGERKMEKVWESSVQTLIGGRRRA